MLLVCHLEMMDLSIVKTVPDGVQVIWFSRYRKDPRSLPALGCSKGENAPIEDAVDTDEMEAGTIHDVWY